jgi:RND family efflux transporter MFP subunit
MRKMLIALIVAACGLAGFCYYRSETRAARAEGTADRRAGGDPRGGGPPGAGSLSRPPMTVELAPASRAPMADYVSVVGNLQGAASVEVASKISGRLQAVSVRIGDQVRRGQLLAVVEDREIREQVRQAEASHEVARATIRQREADLKLAETNLTRSRSLFQRQLIARQLLDDVEAAYQSAQAQLDLSRAQFEQARARLDELKITLAYARILSPVNGFIGKRYLDPGAFLSSSTPIVSVVEIDVVRLVANLVERDLQRVQVGAGTEVEVDAYPGVVFKGRVARVAPVLDPATRTAQMEVEVPNSDFRLKPGMYSRVRLTVATRADALTVPLNAVVDVDGRTGVFTVDGGARRAKFTPVTVGIQDTARAEILAGLGDGQRVVTTGAAALHDGDPIQLPGQPGGRGRPADQVRPGSSRPPRS